jgi:hypothetical protein
MVPHPRCSKQLHDRVEVGAGCRGDAQRLFMIAW